MLACFMFCVALQGQVREIDVTSKVLVHNKQWVKLGGYYSFPQVVMGTDCSIKIAKLIPGKSLKVTFKVPASQGLQFQGLRGCEMVFSPTDKASKSETLKVSSSDGSYTAPEDGEVTLTVPVRAFRLYLKP